MGLKINTQASIQTPCAILCGGASRRMGQDKAMLDFHGQELVKFVFQKYSHIFQDVYLSAKHRYFKLPTIIDSALYLKNSHKNPMHCPLIGLQSVFKHLDAEWIFFASVDTPFLSTNSIEKLFNLRQSNTQILYFQTPLHQHFLNAFFHSSLLDLITKNLSQQIYALSHLFANANTIALRLDDEKELINLNTMQDYQNALESSLKSNDLRNINGR